MHVLYMHSFIDKNILHIGCEKDEEYMPDYSN